jgi:hypothetical protein
MASTDKPADLSCRIQRYSISQTQNPTNKTDVEWAAILDAIGLSPLLLATMGLLKRV